MPPTGRYALFFTPVPGSALQMFGERWLERGPEDAAALLGRAFPPEDLARLTASPRRYGFHATLKAPFELATDATPVALEDALTAFAAEATAIQGPPLQLSALGPFAAFRPAQAWPDIDRLAALAVEHFDRFRAPLTPADRARREAAGLTESQAALLERWGYPYVFDEYRFHMTLSDSLAPQDQARLMEILAPVVAPLCCAPLSVDAVTLVHQPDRSSRFAPVLRVPLRGGGQINLRSNGII